MKLVLQRILSQGIAYQKAATLYRRVSIKKGIQHQCFDTFFNRFDLTRWLAHTSLDNLFFEYRLSGKGNVFLWHHAPSEHTLLTPQAGRYVIDLKAVRTGYLSLTVEGDAELHDAAFYTDCSAPISTCLAIVITTFNREQALGKMLQRFRHSLLAQPSEQRRFTLYVINNGNPISTLNKQGVHWFDNPNLGGSGGFSRGLLEIQKNPSITHCLFMDDDAACEIESILRTYAFLSLANDPNLAIAGAMLYEERPSVLHESGAKVAYQGLAFHPLKHCVDITNYEGLQTFADIEHIDYGAWWYYAFNHQNLVHYPFPFFVRGDDILFGLMNNHHHIITLNGVASWQMDFSRKFGPWVYYLAARVRFITGAYHFRLFSGSLLFAFFAQQVLSLAMGYRYESAHAVIEAFIDGHQGVDFWREHIDTKALRQKIALLTKHERFAPDVLDVDSPPPFIQKNLLVKCLMIASANGHALPRCFFKPQIGFISETEKRPWPAAFLRKQLVYLTLDNQQTMRLTHSKKAFWGIVIKLGWAMVKSVFRINRLLRHYQREIPAHTTKQFWEEQLAKHCALYEKSPSAKQADGQS